MASDSAAAAQATTAPGATPPASTGTTPATAATQHSASSSGPGTPSNIPDWTLNLSPEMKGFVQNKGFKDPTMVLDSYQNLEKLMGAPKERLIKLPEKMDAPEMGEIYDRLGRPKNANEYKFAVPEGQTADPAFTETFQKTFHELGLSRTQGEKIAAKWNEFQIGEMAKGVENYKGQVLAQTNELKKEWGAAYEQNIKVVAQAAQAFGLDKAKVDAIERGLGYKETLKLLAAIGSKIGEDTFHGGEAGNNLGQGPMTPEQASHEKATLMKDQDFVRRYLNGDKEARAKMERVHKMMTPGDASY